MKKHDTLGTRTVLQAFMLTVVLFGGASHAWGRNFVETGGRVVLEAESYTILNRGWEKRTDDKDASGGAYVIATRRRSKSSRLEYRILFTRTGRYRVYLRGQCTSSHDNDCYLSLDGASGSAKSEQGGWKPVNGLRSNHRRWGWSSLPKHGGHTPNDVRRSAVHVDVPVAGVHAFQLGARSKNFKIDKVVLVHESDSYKPSGTGPAETRAVERPAAKIRDRRRSGKKTAARTPSRPKRPPSPSGPSASDIAAARAAWPKLRQAIITGVQRGKKETVYVEIAGRLTGGRLVAADKRGLTLSVAGSEMPIAWSTLKPRRFYSIAMKYAVDPAALESYRRGFVQPLPR